MDGLSGRGEAVWSGKMTLEEANGNEHIAQGAVITCVARWPVSGPM